MDLASETTCIEDGKISSGKLWPYGLALKPVIHNNVLPRVTVNRGSHINTALYLKLWCSSDVCL